MTYIILFKKEKNDIIENAGEYIIREKAEEIEIQLKQKGFITKIVEWE